MYSNVISKLTIYNQERKLYKNQKVIGKVKQDEYNYFVVTTKPEDKYLYVSASNVNGDIDILLNFGEGNFPTIVKANLRTIPIQNGYILIDLQDENLKKEMRQNESNMISFSIGIFGYSTSTYNLIVSSHPMKVLPIENYSSVSCGIKYGEYCFFTYRSSYTAFDTILTGSPNSDGTVSKSLADNFDLLLYTKYLYGKGYIFAKLYKGDDVDNVDFYNGTIPANPDAVSDFQNTYSEDQNLLKVKCNY